MTKTLTTDDRAHAADMGNSICENCQTVYLPVPGYVNDGHQCNSDEGLQDRFLLSNQ